MTQASRPQADNIASFPLPSDPGPYSADQWAEYMQIVYTGDQQTLQGPLRNYLNQLAPADNGSTQVTVDTGAGLVNGHLLISSEQETFVIPAGPVATRIDRVVMCENNTNAEITQTDAGRPFLFPNDLTEYTATPAIPAYAARLVIVRGADGAGLPVIDQTNSKYMVELYRYTINNVPTISSAVDYRYYAQYSSNHLYVCGREGSSATDWSAPGTTHYTPPTLVPSVMQVGVREIVLGIGVATNGFAVTFPVNFDYPPTVQLSMEVDSVEAGNEIDLYIDRGTVAVGGFTIRLYRQNTTSEDTHDVHWMAVGPLKQ